MKATLLILLLSFVSGAEALPPRIFTNPDRIRYDGQCLSIEGKDIFIYSGAFHYFRCPKELWRDRFRKIKEAGFNTVETYAPWNWHEREKPAGVNDFSKADLRDLDDWLAMAEEFGFYVVVRPGPYICAEWDSGGFPRWLLSFKPANPLRERAWLRSDDPAFLEWAAHWYNEVCPIIAKHQLTRRQPGQGGVILVQLENEYDYAGFSPSIMRAQLSALAMAARANGIEVPFFTCWTRAVRGQSDPLFRQIFDTCNFYPRWKINDIQKPLEKTRFEQPDAPLAVAELQGGWFSEVGGPGSSDQAGLTGAQINNLTLFAIQNGNTILNYYMLCGGLNPTGWEARNMTTSYDYNAPIHEWGGTGERYERVRALGQMLSKHGPRLARSETVACQVEVPDKDVTVAERRAQDGGRYFFVRTSQYASARQGRAKVREQDGRFELAIDYKLEPLGSSIFYLPPGANNATQGAWLPEVAPSVSHVMELPAATLSPIVERSEVEPSLAWQPLTGGKHGRLDADGAGFMFYRMHLTNAGTTNLLLQYPVGDAVSSAINGRLNLPSTVGDGLSVFTIPPGSNEVVLLYENHGHSHSGPAIERMSGLMSARLSGGIRSNFVPISHWRMRAVKSVHKLAEVRTDFPDGSWTPVAVDSADANNLPARRKAVFRAAIDLSAGDLSGRHKILTFGRIDDFGWVYVNGKNVGKTTDWSQPCFFDVTSQLHPGRNSIAVVVQNDEGAGGLGAPGLCDEPDSAEVPLEACALPAGTLAEYWKSELDDRGWAASGSNTTHNPGLLTWYRVKFELPPEHTNVPWRLRLEAVGNGFIYLNGRPIGRYWQAGPQHDFYLPECWLNYGAGRSNILTMNLRSTDHAMAISSVKIEPYTDDAGNRFAKLP